MDSSAVLRVPRLCGAFVVLLVVGCGRAPDLVEPVSGEVLVEDVRPVAPPAEEQVAQGQGLEEAIRKAIQGDLERKGAGHPRDSAPHVQDDEARAQPADASPGAEGKPEGLSDARSDPVGSGLASPTEALAGAAIMQRRSDQALRKGDLRVAYVALNEALDLLQCFPDDDACHKRAEVVIEEIRTLEGRLESSGRGAGGRADRTLIDP